MKAQNINPTLLRQIDKELKAILLNDLKKFREEKGKFLRDKPGKSQDNDLLVAWSNIYLLPIKNVYNQRGSSSKRTPPFIYDAISVNSDEAPLLAFSIVLNKTLLIN